MRKSHSRYVVTSFLALSFLFPVIASAQTNPLVPECNTSVYDEQGRFLRLENPCGFAHIVQLAENALDFMVKIAVPLAAIAFAYAGWLYLSARGNPGQIGKAHGIFLNVFIGLMIVLVAWLVVDEILKGLAKQGEYVDILEQIN